MKPLNRTIVCLLLTVITFLTAGECVGQVLWGMTSDGGTKRSGGNIFSLNRDGSGFQERFAFSADGQYPDHYHHLLDYGDGFVYGLVASDNWHFLALFKMKPDGTSYQIIHVFEPGLENYGSGIIKGPDGYIYGGVNTGGTFGSGVFYKILPDGSNFKVLYNFSGNLCSGVSGELAMLPGGFIAGTGSQGLPGYNGVLYKIKFDGTGFQLLHFFSNAQGADPNGVVSATSSGITALYGITFYGGPGDNGTMYRINPDGSNFQLINTNVPPRFQRLVTDGTSLYFSSQSGGSGGKGSIWRQHPLTGTTRIVDFGTELPNRTGQYTGSCFALLYKSGVLYGTKEALGDSVFVPLFRMNTDGSGKQILRQVFNDNTIISAGGNKIIGISRSLNPVAVTNFYSLNAADGSDSQSIHQFENAHGFYPMGSLAVNSFGYLSGFTSIGGGSGFGGTVFQIDPASNQFLDLAAFPQSSDPDRFPMGTLVKGSDGNYYGTLHRDTHLTGGGGIFKLYLGKNASGQIFSVVQILKSFSDCRSCGGGPIGALVEGNDGYLYGTAESGADTVLGGIYRIRKDGLGFTMVHSFTGGSDGSHPTKALIKGNDGFLYGMTEDGGAQGWGTIYRMNTSGLKTVIFQFGSGSAMYSGANGTHPKGALLLGLDGKLYGMATFGGNVLQGTLFRLNSNGSGFQVLHHFDGMNGSLPEGTLIQDSTGMLYGMTTRGGKADMGIVFRMAASGAEFQKLFDFNGVNGKYPKGDLLLVSPPPQASVRVANPPKSLFHMTVVTYPNPVEDLLTFSFVANRSGDVSYHLINESGQIVRRGVNSAGPGPFTRQLNLSGLSSGAYFLIVSTVEGGATSKVMKR